MNDSGLERPGWAGQHRFESERAARLNLDDRDDDLRRGTFVFSHLLLVSCARGGGVSIPMKLPRARWVKVC